MARREGGSRVSGRTAMWVMTALLVFMIGAMIGGGWTTERGLENQQRTIESCLPLADAAALDSCLDGTLQ